MKPEAVKLSSPATQEFWEIPVLFEDDQLLVLNKPANVHAAPGLADSSCPTLLQLMHQAIERGAPWARSRGLSYLMNANRPDFWATGVFILVKNKQALAALTEQFSTSEPRSAYVALTRGPAGAPTFECEGKIAPNPLQMGVFKIDSQEGKKSRTFFTVREQFDGYVLLECRPVPDRPHQIPIHLRFLRIPIVGENLYGGRPLFLSSLKPNYEQKRDREERPLMATAALHLEKVEINHPGSGAKQTFEAPWPKDLTVSIKYLKRYSGGGGVG